jgi:hypothetical protein
MKYKCKYLTQLHVLVLSLLHALLQCIEPSLSQLFIKLVHKVRASEAEMAAAVASSSIHSHSLIYTIAELYEQIVVHSERLQLTPHIVVHDIMPHMCNTLLTVKTADQVGERIKSGKQIVNSFSSPKPSVRADMFLTLSSSISTKRCLDALFLIDGK